MVVALNQRGFDCGENRVARLMRANGIEAKMVKRYKPRQWTSKSKIRKPNLLAENGPPTRPHEIWVADFTYLNVAGTRRYLSTVMDLYTRKIVGFELTKQRDGDMVKRTLEKARKRHPGVRPEIFHSDRGSEYANHNIGQYLIDKGINQSMSGKGNCYDNAHMESFFHSYKSEAIYPNRIKTITQLVQITRSWIRFYNHRRYHSSLGYTSPVMYEKMCA
jgi:transposase InsO family protein